MYMEGDEEFRRTMNLLLNNVLNKFSITDLNLITVVSMILISLYFSYIILDCMNSCVRSTHSVYFYLTVKFVTSFPLLLIIFIYLLFANLSLELYLLHLVRFWDYLFFQSII